MAAISHGRRLLSTSDEEASDTTSSPVNETSASTTTYLLEPPVAPSPSIVSSLDTGSPPSHTDSSMASSITLSPVTFSPSAYSQPPSTATPMPADDSTPAPTNYATPAPSTPLPANNPENPSTMTTGVALLVAIASIAVLISCAGICICIFRRRTRRGGNRRKSGPVSQKGGIIRGAGKDADMERGQEQVSPGVLEEVGEVKRQDSCAAAPTFNPDKTVAKPAGDSRNSTSSIPETLGSTVSGSTIRNDVNTAQDMLHSTTVAIPEAPKESAPVYAKCRPPNREAGQTKSGHERGSSNAATIVEGGGFDSKKENRRANVPKGDRGPYDNQNEQSPVRAPGLKKAPSFAVLQAVMQAAQELAQRSTVPGVVEAATLVTMLVRLFADHEGNTGTSERKLRWCRSIVILLDRASAVLGKGGTPQVEAEGLLLDDVRESIDDLLQIIHAYKSRNKLNRVMTSSLFRRRQQEAEVVVNMAISRLQIGLQVRGDEIISAISCDVRETLELQRGSFEDPMPEDKALEIAEARRERRQRRLDDLEIPEEQVSVTEEVLGKGGFGTVFMADLNGRNAAAKVIPVERDTEGPAGSRDVDSVHPGAVDKERTDPQAKQLKTFMRELEAMTRLRSPHTVNVYGAITSRTDSLVLIMELMSGGDLRAMLKTTKGPLEADYARLIVGDVCAGMAFLHGKRTIHGDVKSANVLFDGYGRAKIADFGTSRWIQRTASTGFATYSRQYIQTSHMSFPWAAPEVWNNGTNSYESDVYSFGIVIWEVLSRKLPWASEPGIEDIYRKVVIQKERPLIPEGAPHDLAELARACWVPDAPERLTFISILKSMKHNGWQEG